ncbi:Lar family restriction alleviation protein [Burkholderia multivorans]|uniref:Lar family restriction alleviation protein n=1 Tax=Burkholderia multivorans TaxID=87883 RepID=UPI001C248E5F|nr:Lar family restriction alleviation protein [Burkholderia multivorans]MBU9248223.1 Lar family restriction alleviation protein [Burkholderia multivorans]
MNTTDKSRADALTDLLPCPFCGREAEAEKIEDACYGVGCRLVAISRSVYRSTPPRSIPRRQTLGTG